MKKKIYVQDLKQGQQIADIFVITTARLAQAKNGPYWQLSFQDKTGQIQARIWSPLSQNFPDLKPEQFVFVRGNVQLFGDTLQINVEQMEFLDLDQVDLASFVPASKTPPEELYTQLCQLLKQELSFPAWKRLSKKIFSNPEIKEALLNAPGGKSIHHAYVGGLLEHTLSVCKICLSICDLYPGLDREILVLAAALHDLGKAFEISPGLSREYTDQGKLLGHIFLGLEILEPHLKKLGDVHPELILHLKHIIISHHGELEFGSPKRPKTHEAFVLHYADNLDAKMNTIDQALEPLGEDDSNTPYWSDYNRSLARPVYRPLRTPKEPNSPKNKEKRTNRCLLPLKA
ncbi:HD domain-containing protein [Desulfohalobiaceae bacterium Ax17]|uniref:3'-5' exoribonuclease YhaM family protein n=1 Tax=Desulfovulcanus ferrireducens TaxID=2831190 RepID=UPI00207BD016|nr:HD domain-containing protein [Desulfovulcanus ferrireducens]MBT8763975.1 HD domain-containing protein [Desulfovulcanus ferrireducens]